MKHELQAANAYADWIEKHPEAPLPVKRMKLDEVCENKDAEQIHRMLEVFEKGLVF